MKFSFLLFMFLPFIMQAQLAIRGRVVDESTGSPVAAASVFVNNTSKGVITDNQGHFQLNDLPVGKHDLVISSVGYTTNVFSFSSDQLPLQLKIELKIRIKEMENVVLEPFEEEGWDKWGRTFTQYFIGTTPNAAQCRIKNSGDLKFRFYKKSNRVVAFSDTPLLLENDALGYDISYQLEAFEVNFSQGSAFYLGYPLYTDKGLGKNAKVKWNKRRQEAYKGSIMHFMHSLYNDILAQEGFEVQRLIRTPNLEKKRVQLLCKGLQQVIRTNRLTGQTTIELTNPPAHFLKDSVAYYEEVLRQGDHRDNIIPLHLSANSLIIDSSGAYKALWFENYLLITYRNELEDSKYLESVGENRPRSFQRSLVTLLNGNYITLDKIGNYYSPQDFFTTGYWAWSEKMGDTLPLDYLQ